MIENNWKNLVQEIEKGEVAGFSFRMVNADTLCAELKKAEKETEKLLDLWNGKLFGGIPTGTLMDLERLKGRMAFIRELREAIEK